MKPFLQTGRRMLPAGILFCFALFALLAWSHTAAAQAKKVVTVEGLTEYQLANGLRYILFPDPSSATVTVNLTVFVGSRHEGYGETGMAHLLEHMVFKGTKLYPEPDKEFQKHGARANGTTWVDRTNYYETMPASDANLEFGIKFEADRLVNCFIKREDLAKEMTVVRNEFEIGENDPESILSQRMMATAFEWHNYGKSTIGNRSDIERVPIENLQAFYRKYYQPDNVLLVIAGKFDEQKAHEYIAKYFGALPRPKRVLSTTYTEEPTQDGERIVTLRRVGAVSVVGVLYHTPAAAHPDCSAVQVLEEVLTAVPSGRLYKALVETKKATSISSAAYAWHDPGVLENLVRVADGTKPEQVRDILLKQLDDIRTHPITDEEVARAKRALLAQWERKLTNSQAAAIELSEWAGAGDWRLMFLHRDRISAVTAQQVNAAAAAYLRADNRTVGIFYPTKADMLARAEIPQAPNLESLLKDYKGGKSLAKGEMFEPTPENIEQRVKRLQLPCGLKLALLPKQTRGNKVVGIMTLRFGNEKSLQGQTTAAAFVGDMLMRGTKKYTRQQLQDELDKLGAVLAAASDAGQLVIEFQAKRDTLPKTLELVHEVLRHPTFPKDEFDILKREQRQQLRKGLTEPTNLAITALRRKLNPYPPNDIRYVPTIEEELARTENLSLEDVVRIYKEQIGASVGELAIVGDFDAEHTVEQIKGIVGDWKSGTPFERIPRRAYLDVAGCKENIITADKKNAVYLAGYQFAIKDNDPRYPALRMANYIFGGSGLTSLFFDRLRQQEGLSYGAGTQFQSSAKDDFSEFIIFAFCNPTNMGKLDDITVGLLKSVHKDGITSAQLAEAKKGYLQEQMVNRSNDRFLANVLAEGLYLGRTFAYYANLDAKMAQLTVDEVNNALRELLQAQRLVCIRAGDLPKADQQ